MAHFVHFRWHRGFPLRRKNLLDVTLCSAYLVEWPEIEQIIFVYRFLKCIHPQVLNRGDRWQFNIISPALVDFGKLADILSVTEMRGFYLIGVVFVVAASTRAG